jgi:hypothetical protein
MKEETKNKAKSRISKRNKKEGITMDFMYSVFGLDENYLDDQDKTKTRFFKRVSMKIKSIVITLMSFINSLPL